MSSITFWWSEVEEVCYREFFVVCFSLVRMIGGAGGVTATLKTFLPRAVT